MKEFCSDPTAAAGADGVAKFKHAIDAIPDADFRAVGEQVIPNLLEFADECLAALPTYDTRTAMPLAMSTALDNYSEAASTLLDGYLLARWREQPQL